MQCENVKTDHLLQLPLLCHLSEGSQSTRHTVNLSHPKIT